MSGDSDERGEGEKFEVDVQSDGRWALKSVPFGYYLSGLGDDRLTCSANTIGETELWMVHLAIHPQVIRPICNTAPSVFGHEMYKISSTVLQYTYAMAHECVFRPGGSVGLSGKTAVMIVSVEIKVLSVVWRLGGGAAILETICITSFPD